MENNEIEKVISEAKNLVVSEQYPQAIKILSSLLAQFPDNADALFLRGKANAYWLSFSEAENDFKSAIKIHPDRADFYLELGYTYLEQEQLDRAATEFLRAKHLSPDDLDVQLSFMKIQMIRGEYDELIPALERLREKHPNEDAAAELLVDCYHAKALENWHVETDKEKMFYALNKGHIDNAEIYLNKIAALSPPTEYVKLIKDDLFEIIKVGKTRKFNGGFFSWVIPIILVISGFSFGGFWGWVYGISAVTYFFANRRPVYVTNHLIFTNKDDISAIDRIMNFIDGDWMVFSSSISGVIFQKAKLALIMQLTKAVLISLFMPLTVFSALRKNFSLKYASIFVLVAGLSGMVSDTVSNYQLERDRSYVASLYEAINTNNYEEFVELESDRPELALKNRSGVLLNAIKKNNPDAFDYLISHFKIKLNQQQGQYYLNYATQQRAKKMIEHFSQYRVVSRKAVPANQKSTIANTTPSKQNAAHPQQNIVESIVINSIPGKTELDNSSFEADKVGVKGWKFGIVNWEGYRHGVVIPNTKMFPDGKSPAGKQIAFLSKPNSWMEQILLIQPKVGWDYRLRVTAGLRLESSFSSGNYELQLYSGSTLLHREKYKTPNRGVFEEQNLYFKMDKALPKSDSFRIRLVNVDANQINFDDVRFYATEQPLDHKYGEVKIDQPKPVSTSEVQSTIVEENSKKHLIVGCWKWSNGGYIIITDDGVAKIKGLWQGKWSIEIDSHEKYLITWPALLDYVNISEEGTAYSGQNIFNMKLKGKRVGKSSQELVGTWIREDGVELKVNADRTMSAAQFKGNWKKIDNASYQMQWPVELSRYAEPFTLPIFSSSTTLLIANIG